VSIRELIQETEAFLDLEEQVDGLANRITGGRMEETAVAAAEPATIKVDFTKDKSPFTRSERVTKRVKIFLWGDSGTGKTLLAIQFPAPVVLDLERGSEQYGDVHPFEVLPANSADDCMKAVDWLLVHKHPYRTLVVDPITVYWEMLQRKWSEILLLRNKQSKGNKFDFYDMQPKDWMPLKSELKEFIRKLLALDMNIICTARAKPLYAEGELMRKVGETFDGEKSLPYSFDTVLRLTREAGKYVAETIKDRTQKLPTGQWEQSYGVFETAFGKRTVTREANPVKLVTEEQKVALKALIKALRLNDEKVAERLESYGAASLEDLTRDNAAVIIEKLTAAKDKVLTMKGVASVD